MKNSKQFVFKNLHLLVSSFLILIIGLTYGAFPAEILHKLFDFKVETTDLKQVFRATMGLYLSMVFLWTVGVFKPKFWITATISNIVFMGGLAIGRLLSFLFDGVPSPYFVGGFLLEITLCLWGIFNLKRFSNDTKT